MAQDETNCTDRRKFLQAGALATAGAATMASSLWSRSVEAEPPKPEATLPRENSGKTGIEVTILERVGCSGARNTFSGRPSPTASASSTRPSSTHRDPYKKWFEQAPEVRKADHPRHQGHAARSQGILRWSTSDWRRWGPTTSTCTSFTAWATGGTRQDHRHGDLPGIQGNG